MKSCELVCGNSWLGSNRPTSAILERSWGPTGSRWVSTIPRYSVPPFGAVIVTPCMGVVLNSLVERGVLDRNAALVLSHHTVVDAGVAWCWDHVPATPASSARDQLPTCADIHGSRCGEG